MAAEQRSAPPYPHVSLVLPAYNEERRLPGCLDRVLTFLRDQPFTWEVVVADDGSTDRSAEIAASLAGQTDGLRLLQLPHGGKGHAVRGGMLAATGVRRFFSDVDLSVDIEDLPRFLPALEQAPVAIGSREAPGAARYQEPVYRHLMGRVYNLLAQIVLLPGIRDTQCGFKGFRADAAVDLFSRQQIDDWGFDIEVLYLARRCGYRIVEVPVHWTYGCQSRIRPLRDSWRMFRDIWRVRWRAWRGDYRSE